MLILLQKSKINIYEKKIILIGLRSKRYQTQNCTFVSNFCLLCSSLSPWNILPEMAKYTAGGLHNFSAHFWKNEFSTKNEKKNTSNNKTRHKSFLESVSISWNQKWFSETTTEWCSCEKKKKSGFYHVGLVFFRIFLMILNKEQSFNEICNSEFIFHHNNA